MCEWTTIDVYNRTGCFEGHLKKEHNITIIEYLNKFPNELKYQNKILKTDKRRFELKHKNSYVVCKLCGEKMKVISNTHLNTKHNITSLEYKNMFPNEKIISILSSKTFSKNAIIGNMNMKPIWTSRGEIEIKEFLESLGIIVKKDRKLLSGKEIDLIIEDNKIGIEYNGLYYHREMMGKGMYYHLNKTIACNNVGYGLLHIFEDEWKIKKDIVKNYLKGIFKTNNQISIINYKIQIITKEISDKFLQSNHIEGSDESDISLGCFVNDELISVITINNTHITDEYVLSRVSTTENYNNNEGLNLLLKHFIKEYSPTRIISFADVRWVLDSHDNMYTKLGFKLIKTLPPDYKYYNNKLFKDKRFHKFGFGKNSLKKRYPHLDFNKTEKELMTELGYDRIWDCGLFKYELIIN